MQGYQVIGVETSEIALQQFQEEQNIKLTEEKCSEVNGSIYQVIV